MRRYETIVILDPDLSEEARVPVFERITDLIPKEGGFLVGREDWGSKKLAYEVKKKTRGYYTRLDYCGNGALVDEMERFFRIDDRVIKYLTVVLDKDADIDRIKEEQAKAAEQQAAAPLETTPAEDAQTSLEAIPETETSEQEE